MNGTIFILDNILGTIIISYHFYSASLYNQNGISNWFEEFPLSFRCWSPWDLEKKHRGCLVLPANKAIPDSGEVTGRSCTIEYDLGAICHNRCSCERRQHPPGAKCQYLLKRNICRQQQCNAGRRRNALQVKRCQVYCSSIHKVIMQYCSSVWCQHGDYACGFFRGSFHEWSWITQTATLCTSNQTSWLYISYYIMNMRIRIPASHWTNVWFAPYIPCSFRKILWATRSGHMPWLSDDWLGYSQDDGCFDTASWAKPTSIFKPLWPNQDEAMHGN